MKHADPLTRVWPGDPDRDPLIGGVETGASVTGRDPARRIDGRPPPDGLPPITPVAEPLDRQAGEQRRQP
ncbi:hypothetical protein [Nonomuraea maheshkhaliensis]|uniref:hypothetical protein n=1 Tax=Nonomuraea maheshkhaliensis TaxID=419590 RepID=UPI0031F87D24